jgi:hypothetical protein
MALVKVLGGVCASVYCVSLDTSVGVQIVFRGSCCVLRNPHELRILLASIISSLSKSKVGQNSDGTFLLIDDSLDQILDGDHTNDISIQ